MKHNHDDIQVGRVYCPYSTFHSGWLTPGGKITKNPFTAYNAAEEKNNYLKSLEDELNKNKDDYMYGEKFNGDPCPQGHTLRYVSNGSCTECQRHKDKKRKKEKRESKNKVYLDDFTHSVFIIGNPERCKNQSV
ncbi:DUF1317 family protein [Photorhabdus laumondii subsp. laumondii]|uniref:DUF1317 family protein n=2 Tax=Photorhabdus TaxID=29487 RepID=A0A6L9JKK7_PHOLM|nr:DUF1317 family protein [Photorhabdus laumondii]MCC8384626.1 DUF1317 family protein [Photorhabdus laumondii]MCC8413328.1 DUF1317 family protein [Photorhabdus laumondii]NDK94994.1 DUF1317 family protein [Photorhabdus laumondii subsp. laumondii]NDL21286.1 DUF1317 family protein [Photorhabdus laumondii subsp. laumondii]NDL30218.1 DUF1317 family protein [Photorhabdus laumondii subsp. laumondii]